MSIKQDNGRRKTKNAVQGKMAITRFKDRLKEPITIFTGILCIVGALQWIAIDKTDETNRALSRAYLTVLAEPDSPSSQIKVDGDGHIHVRLYIVNRGRSIARNAKIYVATILEPIMRHEIEGKLEASELSSMPDEWMPDSRFMLNFSAVYSDVQWNVFGLSSGAIHIRVCLGFDDIFNLRNRRDDIDLVLYSDGGKTEGFVPLSYPVLNLAPPAQQGPHDGRSSLPRCREKE